MKIHELKTHPKPFYNVASGLRTSEYRKDDRGYAVGDILHLRCYEPESKKYTGAEVLAVVEHIQNGFGIPEGYVVMSVKVIHSSLTSKYTSEAVHE